MSTSCDPGWEVAQSGSLVCAARLKTTIGLCVATGLDFKTSTEGAGSVSAHAELQDGAIKLDAGPRESSSTGKTFRTGDSYVLAADLLDPTEVVATKPCEDELAVLSHSGSSTALAYAVRNGQRYYEKQGNAEDDGEVTSGKLSVGSNDPLAAESFGGLPATYFAFRNLEATAYGKWFFNPKDKSIEFLQFNGIEPAMRSRTGATGPLSDIDFELVAGAGAEIRSMVDLRLANRTDFVRHLWVNLDAKTLNNGNNSRLPPPWHYLEKATLQRDSGEKSDIQIIWGGGGGIRSDKAIRTGVVPRSGRGGESSLGEEICRRDYESS